MVVVLEPRGWTEMDLDKRSLSWLGIDQVGRANWICSQSIQSWRHQAKTLVPFLVKVGLMTDASHIC